MSLFKEIDKNIKRYMTVGSAGTEGNDDVTHSQTGDLMMFSGSSVFGSLIRCSTWSEWSHCGIIIRDPWFTKVAKKGLYLLHSNPKTVVDLESGQPLFGTQLSLLQDVVDSYEHNESYIVHVSLEQSQEMKNSLAGMYRRIYGTPYNLNIGQWLDAILEQNLIGQSVDSVSTVAVNSFWCSTLVGYIYVNLGVFRNDTPWVLLSPDDLVKQHPRQQLATWRVKHTNPELYVAEV
jgi:hypothetical protein